MKVLRAHPVKGFTFVEILVVGIVLGILVAIAIPLYGSSQRNSRLSACRANIIALHQAEEAYRVRNRTYTTSTSDLTATLGGGLTCPAAGAAYGLEAGSTGDIRTSVKISCTSRGGHTRNPVSVDGALEPEATPYVAGQRTPGQP